MNFWQIPRVHRGTFLAALLAMLASGHAASSAEWQEIPQGGSRLAIDAPGLDEGSSRFHRRKESGNAMELGRWAPQVGQFPRAEIFANILEGNFHWKKAPYGSLRSETNKWNFLKNKKFFSDESGKYGNGLGRGEFMVFMLGKSKCFSFQQYWGEPNEVRGTSAGSRYLLGYYCSEVGSDFDQETLHAILDSVRAPR